MDAGTEYAAASAWVASITDTFNTLNERLQQARATATQLRSELASLTDKAGGTAYDVAHEIDHHDAEAKLIEAIMPHLDEVIAIGHKRIDVAGGRLAR